MVLWLRKLGSGCSGKYYVAFFEHFKKLVAQPYLYPAADIRDGYQRSVCGVKSVYYRVVGEAVEIMAVIGRQQTDDWL